MEQEDVNGHSPTSDGDTVDLISTEEFFHIILGDPPVEGVLNIFDKKSKKTHSFPTDNIPQITAKTDELKREADLYFEVCLGATPPMPGKRGDAASKTVMPCLWFDLDVQSPVHTETDLPATSDEALEFAKLFQPTFIIDSGHGLQFYHCLRSPLYMGNEIEWQQAKKLIRKFQAFLIGQGRERGWKLDNTSDLARLMRIPGSYNLKVPDNPKEVRVIYYDPEALYDPADFEQLPDDMDHDETKPAHETPLNAYPPAMMENIVENCAWMRHCHDDAAALPEPSWFAMLSILGRYDNGQALVHEWSQPYPKYESKETETKLQHALGAGPRTCENIRKGLDGEAYCKDCPFWGHITSPIQLGNVQEQLKFQVRRIAHEAVKDPSGLYEEENLRVLATLATQHAPAYVKFREFLKQNSIPTKRLDAAVQHFQTEHGDDLGFAKYSVHKGAIIYTKQTQFGDMKAPLCNFNAKIEEEICKDDGRETTLHYKITGQLDNGTPLPSIEVPSGQFAGMNWVSRWGTRAIVCAGQSSRDHLRAAIQTLSRDVIVKHVYCHTGWLKIGNEWVYLTHGGAIGKEGLITGVDVDLGEGSLLDYTLPVAPSGDVLQTSISASMKLLDLVPDSLGIPLLSAIYAAPLNEAMSVDFSVFYFGETGKGKTELVVMAQAHYGKGFHGKNLPGNWVSTANSLEKMSFIAKDALMVVDDFLPKGTFNDVMRMHQLAERVLRGQGNKAGRNRLNADGTIRQTYYPRGLILSTGEDLPKGQSLRGRMLICEVVGGDVKFEVLTEVQRCAAEGVLACSLAGYVQWMAGQMDILKSTLPNRKIKLRGEVTPHLSAHAKTPDIVASLIIGMEMFCEYAKEHQALTQADAELLLDRTRQTLIHADSVQKELQQSEDPVRRFLELLASAFIMGAIHLEGISGGAPTLNPDRWGWEDTSVSVPNAQNPIWKSKGARVGWIRGQDIYLDPDAAFATVQRIASTQGSPITVTQRTLQGQLGNRGILASKGPTTNTVEKSIGGSKKRVLHMLVDKLSLEDAAGAQPGPVPFAVPATGMQSAPVPSAVPVPVEPIISEVPKPFCDMMAGPSPSPDEEEFTLEQLFKET
jgi:hypothetical protein